MESNVYEIIRKLHFDSTYEEIVNALKYTLDYFAIEKDVYKKRCIVKYWGDKFGNFAVVEMLNRLEDDGYNIFDYTEAAIMNASYYFSGMKNIRDFKAMANEIIRIYDTELTDSKNQGLDLDEVQELLEIALDKSEFIRTIDFKKQLYIFLHKKQNRNFNSYVIPLFENPVNRYLLNCFQVQSAMTSPAYVFFHELGHILLCELMGKEDKIPYTFYKVIKKIININEIDSKHKMIELFCDFYAIYLMLDTKYEKYIPYALDGCEKKLVKKYFRHIERSIEYFNDFTDLSRFFYQLKMVAEKNGKLSAEDFTSDEWKQLSVIENCGPSALSILVKESEEEIEKIRKQKAKRIIKDYYHFDRFVENFIISAGKYNAIQILEFFDSFGCKEIYITNYKNKCEYQKLFNVKEELKYQLDIQESNLKNPEAKKETLDDIVIKHVKKMLNRGELCVSYFSPGIVTNPYDVLSEITKIVNNYKLPNHTGVFVELTNFKNHEVKQKRKKTSSGKRDYLKQYVNQQKSGTIGEDFVFEQEKIRLKDYPELVKNIIPYYKTEPLKGFDILSFEIDGTKKHIEVKSSSTNDSNKKIHFFISDNEDEFLRNDPNACIYYVYNFKNKKIREIKREQYLKMKKVPRLFEVDIDCE